MKLKELVVVLEANQDAALRIMLPSGDFVAEHFHVTEVGRVQKDFIDCGGTVRNDVFCLLQAWTAHDVAHRLTAGKLVGILRLGDRVLGTDDLPVQVEYGENVSSNFVLCEVEVTPYGLILALVGKRTDCLAPDKCGLTVAAKCCPGSVCC